MKKYIPKILVYIILGILSFVAIFPIYWMIISSFKDLGTILDTNLIPVSPTIDNYVSAFETMPLWRMLFNSFLYAGVLIIVQISFGILFGYSLSRWDFKGKKLIYLFSTSAWLIPIQTIMIPNYVEIVSLDLNGTLAGMVLPNLVSIFVNLQFFDVINSFPRTLFEAAELDGSNSWKTLVDIVAPNLWPSISAVATISFISAWNTYLWPSLVSTADENSLIQIGIKSFTGADTFSYGPMMAATTIAVLPVLLIYIFLQNKISKNMLSSGIK